MSDRFEVFQKEHSDSSLKERLLKEFFLQAAPDFIKLKGFEN